MGIIETLAAQVERTFTGIDWAPYLKKYTTVDAAVLSRDYVQDLKALYATTLPIATTVGINQVALTVADYGDSYQSVQKSIVDASPGLFEALQWRWTTTSIPVTFSPKALRDFFIGQFALLKASKEMHENGMIFMLGMSLAEIGAHADKVARAYRTFLWLYEQGYLDRMKTDWDKLAPNKSASGIGFLPVAWLPPMYWGLVVISLVGVAIICYGVLSNNEMARRLKAQQDICAKLIESKDPTAPATCKEMLALPANSPLAAPQKVVEQTVASLSTAATVIGVVYLGTLVLPSVLSSIQSVFTKKSK